MAHCDEVLLTLTYDADHEQFLLECSDCEDNAPELHEPVKWYPPNCRPTEPGQLHTGDREATRACDSGWLVNFFRNWPEPLFLVLVCILPEVLTAIVRPQGVTGMLACVAIFFFGGILAWFALVIIGSNLSARFSKKDSTRPIELGR